MVSVNIRDRYKERKRKDRKKLIHKIITLRAQGNFGIQPVVTGECFQLQGTYINSSSKTEGRANKTELNTSDLYDLKNIGSFISEEGVVRYTVRNYNGSFFMFVNI